MTTHMTLRRSFSAMFVVTLLIASALAANAGGGFYREGRVWSYSTDRWEPWAPAGYHRLVVRGDGDTDLDCYVYDRFGRLLGADADGTDYCIVRFRNPTAGTVQIVIRNLGSVYNDYQLSLD